MLLSIPEQCHILQRICGMFGCIGEVDKTIPEDVVAKTDIIKTVYINKYPKTRDSLVSAIMHEVCHILAAQQGKYKTYHKTDGYYSKKDIYSYQKTAINAEVYVDTWAERLTKMYFPGVVYEQSYRTKEDKLWKKAQVDKWVSDSLLHFSV